MVRPVFTRLLYGFVVAASGFALSITTPASLSAQDSTYMGIDLTAPPEPTRRSLSVEMVAKLNEGVALGCLAFEPPKTYSQISTNSEECRAFIAELAAEQPEPQAELTEAERWRAMPLTRLAQLAQSGSKHAQLELGMRFEDGIAGVEVNWDNALELYKNAARATPARQAMAVSSTQESGVGGTVNRRTISPRIPGLKEARKRRKALEAKMKD